MYRVAVGLFALAIALGFSPSAALAQVPPHAAGSICFTPTFWCWVDPPGTPGMACYCYDSNGVPVPGYLN